MSLRKSARHRTGFTLIELLIVIVVIAILALVVIPRVMGASRKAKETVLKGNLHQLRTAIQQFQADIGGFPTDLDQMQLPATSVPKAIDEDGVELTTITEGAYKGPYLTKAGGIDGGGIPKNPFEPTNSTDWKAHWEYYTEDSGDNPVGTVLSKVTGKTLEDNIDFTKL